MTNKRHVPLDQIATDAFPLRASMTPHLSCTLRWILLMLRDEEGGPGSAAQTGTLVHAAIDEWLRGSSLAAAREHMDQLNAGFRSRGESEGDCAQATKWLDAYTGDRRNAPLGQAPADPAFGIVEHAEANVVCRLDPADIDPTGQQVVIAGTLDQLRRGPDGMLRAWDLKSTRFETTGGTGQTMWLAYLLQLGIYALGAEQMLGEPVGVGGIIALRGYGARLADRKEVFIPASLPTEHLPLVLETVTEQIALIRSGHISPRVGPDCAKCYAASGPGECLSRLAQIVGGGL